MTRRHLIIVAATGIATGIAVYSLPPVVLPDGSLSFGRFILRLVTSFAAGVLIAYVVVRPWVKREK